MKTFKNTTVVTALLFIYTMAVLMTYTIEEQNTVFQKSDKYHWYQVDDVKDHFTHILPIECAFNFQSSFPSTSFYADDDHKWVFQWTHSFHFKGTFKHQIVSFLNRLVLQKKADLLFPSHYFP